MGFIEKLGNFIVAPACAHVRENFCAISLQKQAILLGIPKYISPFIILIILTLFVAVFPCLPITYDF